MTPADRRRRTRASVAALLTTLVVLVLGARTAGAEPCGGALFPPCTTTTEGRDPTTTTTEPVDDTTTTLDRGTDLGSSTDSGDEVDGGTTGSSTRRTTSTTERRSSATTEEVTSTTDASVTVSTLNDLLLPGDGTQGAESTTTTQPQVATGKSGLSDDQLIGIVVGSLAVLAGVVALLTWRYWSVTRPVVVEPRARGDR